MWYVIYSRDTENSLEKRMAARSGHLDRLHALLEQGRLLLAGPRPALDCEEPRPAGFRGSLVVAEFDSLKDAQAWADADPYAVAGVYDQVEVSPFKRVMPV